MIEPTDEHYEEVLTAIADGEVVPVLGAGINLCGRPPGVAFQRGQYLPNGSELAEYLATEFQYPSGDRHDLLRVSQYAAVRRGAGPLYKRLHHLFSADYPTTPVHAFLASLPGILRSRGSASCYQLLVTTNYDDVLEAAFDAAGEPFDLVCYVAEGPLRGKFWHRPPGGEARLIDVPNECRGLSLDERSVILKIHGAVDRSSEQKSSFVITEDHYIDYLTRTDISNFLPVNLAAKLRNSSFLFLGYSLRDWNLRVILYRIWSEQTLNYSSWAVQLNPDRLDDEFWNRRDVQFINARLEDYIAALGQRVQGLVGAGG